MADTPTPSDTLGGLVAAGEGVLKFLLTRTPGAPPHGRPRPPGTKEGTAGGRKDVAVGRGGVVAGRGALSRVGPGVRVLGILV